MNAYKLADQLDNVKYQNGAKPFGIYANMFRQQADRIAELEKIIFDRNVDLAKTINRIAELEKKCKWYDDTCRLSTDQQSAEPFIWLKQDFDGEWIEVHPNKGIPLYTTPQIKELSDEEIDEVLYSMDWAHDPVKFARAILKKASEK